VARVFAAAAALFPRRGPRLESALRATGRLHQLIDAQGRVLWSCPEIEALCGAGRAVPDWLTARLDGDHAADPEQRRPLERLLSAAAPEGVEEDLRLASEVGREGQEGAEGGEPVWWRVRAQRLPDAGGATLWSLKNVTDQRQMLETLREEHRRTCDLLEHAPVGFYSVDAAGSFLYANQAFVDWLKLPLGSLLGGRLRLHDLLAQPGPSTAAHSLLAPRAEGDPPREGEVELVDAEGGRFIARVTQDAVRDGQGALQTRGVVRHLSGERAAAEALALTELRFRRLFDEAPVGIAQLDDAGIITECNKAFGAMAGLKAHEAVGRPLPELVQQAQRPQLTRAIQEAIEAVRGAGTGAAARRSAAGLASTSMELRLEGAPEAVCSLSLRSFRDDEGFGGGLIAHLLDLTEQKALEAQFAQSQKMQAVGQLAGGIAHDFNNLLTAMIGFSDLLLLRHRPGDQSFADIMQIKQNANRAANLVRQLLAFSRQQTLQPRVLNLTDILAEITHLLRRLIGEAIELKVVHGRDLGPVKADQGQLEQVIINLAVNARDAMPEGGRLVIRTANLTLEEDRRSGGETLPSGSYVLLEVEDSGQGIPPENLSRVFEPFFSTKEVGEGTGLGLSTVYGIVKQTGGFVFVESEVGVGTRFSIYLPRHARTQEQVEPESPGVRDLTGRGRVLLVEDEDAVRAFSARALRNKGYEVLEARSGELALDHLRGDPGDPAIDLLITDVVMPRVDGPTLVKRARERLPELKVIYISGYAEDSFRSRVDSERGIHFLPKPFSLKQLASKVKEVMGEPDLRIEG